MSELSVFSPFDQSPIASVHQHTAKEAEQMLCRAIAVFGDRSAWISKDQRIILLEKTAKLLEAEREERAMMIAKEGGKPLTDARIEVGRAIEGIGLAVKNIQEETPQTIPMGLNAASQGRTARAVREPIGVVVAISAFNHPLNLIVHQVIPAIAVGCPVIIKPASTTPLSCMRLVELLYKAGLPKDWCQVCICDSRTAEKLATDPRIGFLSFIGSARVGWMLRSKLAPGVRCALEHGGAAPAIVEKDADLDKAIPLLIKGGFYHAGQVCVSVQRIFAEHSIARKLAEGLASAASKLKVGDPTLPDTEVGPLILPKEVDRVHEWVQEAKNTGAEILCGGKKLSATTYAPTVLWNPPDDARISREEVFGPVVAVYSYGSVDEAVRRANQLPYAFQAAVFTGDETLASEISSQLDATAVLVNDHTAFRVDWMPFGGRRHSGLGLGGIGYTMHDMTQIKMTVTRT